MEIFRRRKCLESSHLKVFTCYDIHSPPDLRIKKTANCVMLQLYTKTVNMISTISVVCII